MNLTSPRLPNISVYIIQSLFISRMAGAALLWTWTYFSDHSIALFRQCYLWAIVSQKSLWHLIWVQSHLKLAAADGLGGLLLPCQSLRLCFHPSQTTEDNTMSSSNTFYALFPGKIKNTDSSKKHKKCTTSGGKEDLLLFLFICKCPWHQRQAFRQYPSHHQGAYQYYPWWRLDCQHRHNQRLNCVS